MNERTPFYIITTIFLFITIVLSLVSTFHLNQNGSDFFQIPELTKENLYMIIVLWISYVGIFTNHAPYPIFYLVIFLWLCSITNRLNFSK